MAQVVVICKNINHTLWPLVASLRAQQHQVTVITDRNTSVPPLEDHLQGVNVLTYFKKWSFWESVKIAPTLMSLSPQILHIISDQGQLSPAEIALSTLSYSLPHCVLSTSILNWDLKTRQNRWLQFLLERSDVVTGPSVDALAQLRGLNIKNRKQSRGLLPPLIPFSTEKNYFDNSQSPLDPWIQQKTTVALPWVFHFSEVQKNLPQLQKISEKYQILFLGSLNNWPLRQRKRCQLWLQEWNISFCFSESHRPQEVQDILKKCEALWLAGLPLNSIEYSEYLWMGINSESALVIDQRQAQIHSGVWKNSVNVHILPSENGILSNTESPSWRKSIEALLSRKSLNTAEKISPSISRELIDHSTNDLNRLYAKAMSTK